MLLAGLTLLAGQPAARATVAGDAVSIPGTWVAQRGARLEAARSARVNVTRTQRRGGRVRLLINVGDARAAKSYWRLKLAVVATSSDKSEPATLDSARVTVAYLDNGERIGWAPRIRLASWAKRDHVDTLLQPPPGTDALRIDFVTPPRGTWTLDVPTLAPVVLTPWHRAAMVALAAGWTGLVMSLLMAAVRRSGSWRIVVVLAGLALVVLGTGFSRTALSIFTAPLVTAIGFFVGVSSQQVSVIVQKGGHAAAFLVLALALCTCRRELALSLPSVIGLCVAVAIGSEALQLFIEGRSPRAFDLLIDLMGALAGVSLFAIASVVARARVARRPATGRASS